jgi:hypothetical protein
MIVDNRRAFLEMLFEVRQALVVFYAALTLFDEDPDIATSDIIEWLHKWHPSIKHLSSEEARLREYCNANQGTAIDLEKLMEELGENLKDIAIAYDESQKLSLPENEKGNEYSSFAITAAKNLNRILFAIKNQQYFT